MSDAVVDVDVVALQIAERLRDLSTEDGRVPFRTGDLRKSIVAELVGHGSATVGSNLNYARPVHEGRPAITIVPKNKKWLRFTVGGSTRFAKKVYQPARAGKPFLREAAQEMSNDGYAFLDRYLEKQVGEEVIKEIKKGISITLKA